jgi:hypothetical protein
MEMPNAQPTPPINVVSADPLPADEGRELIDELMKQMDKKAEDAEHYGGNWSGIRLTTMLSLIVLSAVVAAEKTIASLFTGVSALLNAIIAICSILVAIGTAFDQSVKPGIRWRLSSGYATKFRGLKIKARMVDPTNRAAISQLSDAFEALDQKWLEDTTV